MSSALKVIRTERVKKACTKCDCIVEAPAPSRPIERGIAGPGLLAHVLTGKYCEHLPLYRQSEIVCLGKKNSYDLCQILSPKRPYAAPGASLYRGLKNLKQSDCILDFTNSYSGILAP